jgi:hypothetical protein
MLIVFGGLDKHYHNAPNTIPGGTYIIQNSFWTCLALGHKLFESHNVRALDYLFKTFYENFPHEIVWNERTFYFKLNLLTTQMINLPLESH